MVLWAYPLEADMAVREAHDDPETRFWRRVEKQADGCWFWTGFPSGGYGRIRVAGVRVQAHRYSYELHVGLIPDGLQVDHLCRNRLCVNPDHLEPVTPRQNTLRGNNPSAVTTRTGVCKRGHFMDDANTRVRPNGKRECRACSALRQRLAAKAG